MYFSLCDLSLQTVEEVRAFLRLVHVVDLQFEKGSLYGVRLLKCSGGVKNYTLSLNFNVILSW